MNSYLLALIPQELSLRLMELQDRFFLSDGGKSVEKLLAMSDEPIRPEMERYGRAVDHGVYNLWQLHQERNTLQKDYLDRWNALGLDAILGMLYLQWIHEYLKYHANSSKQPQRHPLLPSNILNSGMSLIRACSIFWTIPAYHFPAMLPLIKPLMSQQLAKHHLARKMLWYRVNVCLSHFFTVFQPGQHIANGLQITPVPFTECLSAFNQLGAGSRKRRW